jgi:hypothetical protein
MTAAGTFNYQDCFGTPKSIFLNEGPNLFVGLGEPECVDRNSLSSSVSFEVISYGPCCTPTPTTTTTTTTVAPNCYAYNVTVEESDLIASDDGNVYFVYEDCNGITQTNVQSNSGTYINAFCAISYTGAYYLDGGIETNASSSANVTTAPCTGECTEFSADGTGAGGTVYYIDCNGNPQSFVVALGEISAPFCGIFGSVTSIGPVVSILGPCTL